MIYASARLYSEQFTPELICEWSTKRQLLHINPDYVTSSEVEKTGWALSVYLGKDSTGILVCNSETAGHAGKQPDSSELAEQ